MESPEKPIDKAILIAFDLGVAAGLKIAIRGLTVAANELRHQTDPQPKLAAILDSLATIFENASPKEPTDAQP